MIRQRPLIAYFVITLGLSSFIWLLLFILLPNGLEFSGGSPKEFNLTFTILFLLGGGIPSIVGITLTYLIDGVAGLRQLFARLRIHGHTIPFLVVAALIPPICGLAARTAFASFAPVGYLEYHLIPGFVVTGLLAGIIEEFGWRGFATERLNKNKRPFHTGLIVGIFWSLWHFVGVYWALGTQFGALLFPYYVVALIVPLTSYSVILAYIHKYNTNSLFLAILMHAALSATASVFLTPQAQIQKTILLYAFYSAAAVLACVLMCAVCAFHRQSPQKPQ